MFQCFELQAQKNAAGARRGKCNRYKRLKNATSIKSKKYNQCHCNAKREIKRKAITKRWPDLNWSDSLCVRVKDRLLILLGTLSCKIFCFLLYCLVQLFCTQLFRTHPVWTFFQSRNGCHSLQPEKFQLKENIQFNSSQSYCYTIRGFSFGFFESLMIFWVHWCEAQGVDLKVTKLSVRRRTSLSYPWPEDLRFACVGHQMPYAIIV